MKRKIFLTGATGFLGSNLARKLCQQGYQVKALIRPKSSHPFLENLNYEKIIGDLNNLNLLKKEIKDCHFVIHSAASISFQRRDYEKCYRVNVLGTRHILEAALYNKVRKFIHISAGAAFGLSKNKETVFSENSPKKADKGNIYGYTKKLAEDEVLQYIQKGLSANIVIFSTIYGAGDLKLNSGSIIKAIYSRKLKITPPGGTSFISVNNAVDGLILVLKKAKPGQHYIFSTENLEYLKLCNVIAKVLKVPLIRHKIPRYFSKSFILSAYGLEFILRILGKDNFSLITPQIIKESFSYKYFNSQKAVRELNWQPKENLSSAVQQAFNFYKKQKLIS